MALVSEQWCHFQAGVTERFLSGWSGFPWQPRKPEYRVSKVVERWHADTCTLLHDLRGEMVASFY